MRVTRMTALLSAGLIVLLGVLPAGADRHPKISEKITIEGTVMSIDPLSSAFTLRATDHARGTFAVLVQSSTQLRISRTGRGVGRSDEDRRDRTSQGEDGQGEAARGQDEAAGERVSRPASISDLRVGDRLVTDVFRLDDGRLLALGVEVLNRAIEFPPELELVGLAAQGVVVGKTRSTLTVLDDTGTAHLIVVPMGIAVMGRRASFASIAQNDIVRVDGVANADGSVTAQQLEVVFVAAYQVTGRVTQMGPQFIIINKTLPVNIGPDTLLISGSRPRSFDDLRVGQLVTASGTPITIAGFMIGVNARVILF
jgi:hypothetical protein